MLMAQHGWDNVSVQDICDSANVGRSTFYVHFQSKEQLLTFSLDGLRIALGAQSDTHKAVNNQGLRFVRNLLVHIHGQRQLSRAIVGRRSSFVVQERFRDLLMQLVDAEVPRMTPPQWQREASVHYIAASLWGLLTWWVDAAEPLPIDQLEALFQQLTMPTLVYASQQK